MEDLTFDSYPFLKELGLDKVNHGALVNGKWIGSGSVRHSINPSDKKVLEPSIQKIAEIHFANGDDYEKAVAEMVKVKDIWRTVILFNDSDPHARSRRDCQGNWASVPQQEERFRSSYFP
jgi:hypothetical protein